VFSCPLPDQRPGRGVFYLFLVQYGMFCILKIFFKTIKLNFIFLVFLDYFDTLMPKIFFKK
jgi:hypothetical protein